MLHLRAHLHHLLHVRCLWRHDVQEDRPANAGLLTAFHALFCLSARFFGFLRFFAFCRLRKKQALPFLMRAQCCASSSVWQSGMQLQGVLFAVVFSFLCSAHTLC
jgi:hypothetical protein